MSEISRIFKFTEGVNTYYRTNANKSETFESNVYTPSGIKLESDIESKQEASRANLKVSIPITDEMALRWIDPNLSIQVSLIIYVNIDGVFYIDWQGVLSKVGTTKTKITLTFDDGVGDTRFGTNSPVIQIGCPYVLYGWGCFLDKEDFADSGTIDTVSGLVVTISEAASQADGWYNGGILKAVNGDLVMITKHVGNQLTLIRSAEIAVSDAVTIYRGCDRSIQTCDTKFSNKLRYSGYTRIPTVNTFAGSPIV